MLVLHERKSRVMLAARLTGETAAETISVMLAVFGRINPALRKSITFDNDTAFAQHTLLRTMRDMATWFCDAYASWQKGGVENANGRLRRWLPRHIDIDRLSDEEIQDIVITANLTPRKCLGFKTPFQGISKSLAKTSKFGFHDPLHLAPESTLTTTTLECMGEVLALLRKDGIDSHLAFNVLTNSLFDSPVHKSYGGKIVDGRYSPPAMAVPLAIKDLRLGLAEAERTAVPMPAASLVHDHLVAMMARGWSGLDWSALGLLAAVEAGLNDGR